MPGASTRVIIAGGGVAAFEALLALRALAEDRVEIEMMTPSDRFVVPAYSVGSPLGLGRTPAYDVAAIAADRGATVRNAALSGVNAADRLALTSDGDEIPFDALLIAVGARRRPSVAGAVTFAGRREEAAAVRAVMNRFAADDIEHVVFAVPEGPTWPLPAYELALMAAGPAGERPARRRVSLVTPEPAPLAVFGETASDAVRERLKRAGVELHTSATPTAFADGVLRTSTHSVRADAVVALPHLAGPGVGGLPSEQDGFLPVDAHGAVDSVAGIFAAGDATAFPIKHGGLGADQADACAEAIATMAGAPVTPQPFAPVLRGLLLTADAPEYLRAEIRDGHAEHSTASREQLWWPASKITGRYLAPYLAARHEIVVDAEREPGTGTLPVQARFEAHVVPEAGPRAPRRRQS